MKILFVCEIDWMRRPVIDMHLLAEGLSLLGHNVYAVDYECLWWASYRRPSKNGFVARALDGAKVYLIHPPFVRVSFGSRLSAWFTHWAAIWRVMKDKRIDVVVLYSVPTNGLQTIYWARRFGIPVVFRSIDILHALVVEPLLGVATEQLEKVVYRRVDMALTISPKLSDYMIRMGANAEKVHYLPMPVDTKTFRPFKDENGLRERWGIASDDRVILFMGTLYQFSGLGKFVKGMHHILKRVPKAKLVVVGDGRQRGELERLISEMGLQERVVITGFQVYSSMPSFINLADVCINTFEPVGATVDIFPGKTVQFLACGKPLVATPLPGMKAVIDDGCGIVYAANERMADEVVDLLQSPEKCHSLGRAGLEHVRRTHSCDVVVPQLEEALRGVVSA